MKYQEDEREEYFHESKYAVITVAILKDPRITIQQKVLLCFIQALSNSKGYCFASNKYLADLIGVKKDSVTKMLQKLEDYGFIGRVVKIDKDGMVTFRSIVVFENPIDKNTLPSHERGGTLSRDEGYAPAGLVYNIDNNIEDINNNNIMPAKKKKKDFVPPTLDEVKIFFRENGYTEEISMRAFKHYEENDWKDTYNNKVLNWKSKMRNNWFKDQYKIQEVRLKVRTAFGDIVEISKNQYDSAEPGYFKQI
jgi:DNA-binding MarR family transcriptional regulator